MAQFSDRIADFNLNSSILKKWQELDLKK